LGGIPLSESPVARRPNTVTATFSTLVDAMPKFELQARAWAWSLLQAGIPAGQIVAHHTPQVSQSFRSELGELGVTTREVPPHPSGHPACNKVQQLRHGTWTGAELVVLCDADVVWLDPHHIPRVPFAAKIVDRPNPPESCWRKILGEAELSTFCVPVDVTESPNERTPATNFNGGLYLLDSGLAHELGEAWDERVEWLGRRQALLEGHAAHRDQVAVALALLDLDVTPVQLDRGWNFPIHKEPRLLQQPIVHIRALHHHDRRDQTGNLLPVGVDWIDEAVARANEMLSPILRPF
jgi:hypothetical protein